MGSKTKEADPVDGIVAGIRRAIAHLDTSRDERALARARRAIGRLARLLGDADPGVNRRALALLVDIGPLAVAPLASALSRATDARHRAAIVAALGAIGPKDPTPVAEALIRVTRRDPDAAVRTLARAALTALIVALG